MKFESRTASVWFAVGYTTRSSNWPSTLGTGGKAEFAAAVAFARAAAGGGAGAGREAGAGPLLHAPVARTITTTLRSVVNGTKCILRKHMRALG